MPTNEILDFSRQSCCVDAGSNHAFDLGMDTYTTRVANPDKGRRMSNDEVVVV